MTPRWHLLTGEYPPQPGGVSDYTALVAAGLADAGAEVHVWAPPAAAPTPTVAGVTVHREAGRWSPADLKGVGGGLDACPGPRRLLVQYTPSSWGYKSLNFAFGPWLRRRQALGDEIWLMVHEAYYTGKVFDKPIRWILPLAHRLMMRETLAASTRAFVSTPRYEKLLRPWERGGRRPITWLPIPSTIPVVEDAAGVAALRRRLAPEGQSIVGSFGTFGGPIRTMLRAALVPLLSDHPERIGLLLGRGGKAFAEEILAAHPALAGRIVAPGGLEAGATSLHIQACDLLLQPFHDGVCARRTSMMAAISHGAATVTTLGPITEPVWTETACTVAVPAEDLPAFLRGGEALLADPTRRAALGRSARGVYDANFSIGHTIKILLDA